MGWFSSDKKEVKGDISSLPELPRLPDFPQKDEKRSNRLPSYPSDSLGSKFSQGTIKDAVTGEKGGEGFSEADEFESEDRLRMMQEPLRRPITNEFEGDVIPEHLKEKKNEPIFVRIDKFEEALKIFERTKDTLAGMEKVLENIKKVRDKEEDELRKWEGEAKLMKEQIEKVDKDVFSKID